MNGTHQRRTLRGAFAIVTGILLLFMVQGYGNIAVTGWASVTPDSFADLAEKLKPAVVNISTS